MQFFPLEEQRDPEAAKWGDVSYQTRELPHVLKLSRGSRFVFHGTLPSCYAVNVPNAFSKAVQKMVFNLSCVLLSSARNTEVCS